MTFHKGFAIAIVWRLVLIGLLMFIGILSIVKYNAHFSILLIVSIFIGIGIFDLYRFVNDTNRRLARFFETIRYADFAVRFNSGHGKGESFELLSREFNNVIDAFRKTRAEKEANLVFINTIVQHISTGLLAFDSQNNVLISNSAAFQQLGIYRLHHLRDLPSNHTPFRDLVQDLEKNGKALYQPEPNRQISVLGVALNLQGREVKLFTLQNIHTELQRKEVDAWRNLTRVLRHEMMNSITPIVSLIETMQEIVSHDLPKNETTDDLSEALDIVGQRSKSLVNFVDAYRSFTAIPAPKLQEVSTLKLLQNVLHLSEKNLKEAEIEATIACKNPEHKLICDQGQIEMILLNLIKNARESYVNRYGRTLTLTVVDDTRLRPMILVKDNGPGIADELIDEIFIPFFTTKSSGTGVGLSISKQIMQLHGGDISVQNNQDAGVTFMLEF